MLFDTNKNKGRAGLSMAIAYYGSNGYTILLPLDDTQDYDLVIEKGNVFQKVQVKATGQLAPSGKFVVSLRNFGGTNGSCYGRVINSSADLLFVCTEAGRIYEYRVSELTQTNALTLQDNFEVFI